MMYLHFWGEGDAAKLTGSLKQALSKSKHRWSLLTIKKPRLKTASIRIRFSTLLAKTEPSNRACSMFRCRDKKR